MHSMTRLQKIELLVIFILLVILALTPHRSSGQDVVQPLEVRLVNLDKPENDAVYMALHEQYPDLPNSIPQACKLIVS